MAQLFDAHMVKIADYDCFSQVVFKSIEDYKRMKDDPWYQEKLMSDHLNFADLQRSSYVQSLVEVRQYANGA